MLGNCFPWTIFPVLIDPQTFFTPSRAQQGGESGQSHLPVPKNVGSPIANLFFLPFFTMQIKQNGRTQYIATYTAKVKQRGERAVAPPRPQKRRVPNCGFIFLPFYNAN